MDAIEKAIRTAFEKGDAENRAFREKVYRQAFAALDRAMQAHPNLTVEAAIGRRKALQDKIAAIETEFLPAGPARAPDIDVHETGGGHRAEAAPSIDAHMPVSPRSGAAAPAVESVLVGSVEFEPRPGEVYAPRLEAHDRSPPDAVSYPAAVDVAPDIDLARGERRRPFAAMFFAVTLITAAGIGGWWAYQTGLFQSAAERDTSVPNPPATVVEEDFAPEEEDQSTPPGTAIANGRDWISVFLPNDPTLVSAPAGAEADVMQDESGSFMRIRSGPADSTVIFDVGQGILEQIAGKAAVFDIVARAEEGQETQISVSCDFGELGDCGRKRYVVGYERGEYLFEAALPAGQPGAGGSIAIDSDFGDEGKAVDIYEIRVSISE